MNFSKMSVFPKPILILLWLLIRSIIVRIIKQMLFKDYSTYNYNINKGDILLKQIYMTSYTINIIFQSFIAVTASKISFYTRPFT